MGGFWLQGGSDVFSSVMHGDAVLSGYGGTDCSCILLVTSVISLAAGVDLTSDTWGLAKLCPGGSDCRLTSSPMGLGIVGSDFIPTTRGAFAGFAVNTKAACVSSLSDAVHHGPRGYGLYRPGLPFFRGLWLRDW